MSASGEARPCTGEVAAEAPGSARYRVDVGRPVLAVAVSPDGALLATGDARGEVCLRDARTGASERRLGTHDGPVTAVAFTAGGVASAGGDGVVRIWDVTTGKAAHELDQAPARRRRGARPAGHQPTAVLALAAEPGGGRLVTGAWDGRVRLWDAGSGELVRDIAALPVAVVDVAFAPDGALVAVAAASMVEANLYDPDTGKLATRASGYSDPPVALAFAPDGSIVSADGEPGLGLIAFERVSSKRYQAAEFRDLGGDQAARALGVAAAVPALKDRPAALLGTAGGEVVVAEIPGARRVAVLRGHGDEVAAVAALPDGTGAVSAGQDGRVIAWDLTALPAEAEPAGRAGAKGVIPGAYRALRDAGCDPARAGVATPIEARILRNAPYAMAGRPFRSEELRVLYHSDGTWYQPGESKDVDLSRADKACVARLKKHEKKLRRHAALDREVEKRLTRSVAVFAALRERARPGWKLGEGEQRASEDQVLWITPCNKGCKELEILCEEDPAGGAPLCEVIER